MDSSYWFIGGVVALVAAWFIRAKIRARKAHAWVAEGAILLDVRSTGEFAGGHLPNAKNIPIEQLPRRLKEVGPKDKPVVVYCLSGSRSAMAASQLQAAGFVRVLNMGPMAAW